MSAYIQTLSVKKLNENLAEARRKIAEYEQLVQGESEPRAKRRLAERIFVQEVIEECYAKELERRGNANQA